MDQVAHQAVVIQFILEMAANSQQDPRGCFRQFFRKAKVGHTHTHLLTLDFSFGQCDAHSGREDVADGNSFLSFINLFRFPLEDGQDVYLEVFYTELEAFKRRLREHTVRCNGKPESKDAWTSSALPPVGPLLSARARCRLLLLSATRWQHSTRSRQRGSNKCLVTLFVERFA